MSETPQNPEPVEPQGPAEIQFDDFAKVQLVVGTVLEASEHPNADKLLVLNVDIGAETRTICAGIKAWYAPESLVGKNVVLVANLAPRKMRGIESQGMLLAASTPDKSDVIVVTTEKPAPAGASVS